MSNRPSFIPGIVPNGTGKGETVRITGEAHAHTGVMVEQFHGTNLDGTQKSKLRLRMRSQKKTK